MKSVPLVLATTCIGLVLSAPLDSEVELVPKINTNTRDPEVYGGAPSFPTLFFGRGHGRSRGRSHGHPFFRDIFSFLPPPPYFDRADNANGTRGEGFGIFGVLMKNFAEHIKALEDRLRVVMNKTMHRENEVEDFVPDLDLGDLPYGGAKPEVNYSEKVLPDGTVLKINRTRFSGHGDDGNSFFSFHSTKVVSDDGKPDDKRFHDDEVKQRTPEEDVGVDPGLNGFDA